MPEVNKALRNVYFDTAVSPLLYQKQVFATAASLVGPEKILLGSDYPLVPHRRLAQELHDSGLEPEAKKAILGQAAVVVHASEPVGHSYAGKGSTTPDKLYRFILNFPENDIICAHWGGGLPFYGLMPEVNKALRNVYFDTAVSPLLYQKQVFATAASLVGPEKILLGSDYPLVPHRRLAQELHDSGLEPEAKKAILGENAVRLLKL